MAIIDASRRINWDPGIPGGIPFYPIDIDATDAPYNADPTGVADSTAGIQQAIDDCTLGQAVFLPAGEYKITAKIDIDRQVVLRGAGMNDTVIKYDEAGTITLIDIFTFSSGFTTPTAMTAGIGKDSTVVTVASTAGLSVGDYVCMSELNRSANPLVTTTGEFGSITWAAGRERSVPEAGTRALAQGNRIEAINGSDLTLRRPIFLGFDSGQTPDLYGRTPLTGAGIEDFTIWRSNTLASGQGHNVEFRRCAECWALRVKSKWVGSSHFRMRRSNACEIRECWADGNSWSNQSDRNYGFYIWDYGSDHLIINNVADHCRHSLIFEGGGSGCVYAYNFCIDAWVDPGSDFCPGDADTHGGHPYMNLFEGNKYTRIAQDWAFGSSSHNTHFREHAGIQSNGGGVPKTSGKWACVCDKENRSENVVGCVLGYSGMGSIAYEATDDASSGGPGIFKLGYTSAGSGGAPVDSNVASTIYRHGNYDYHDNNVKWDAGNSDHDLPQSLFLNQKPAWFG